MEKQSPLRKLEHIGQCETFSSAEDVVAWIEHTLPNARVSLGEIKNLPVVGNNSQIDSLKNLNSYTLTWAAETESETYVLQRLDPKEWEIRRIRRIE